MEIERVVSALSALAQETRLKVFRELVKVHNPDTSCQGACGEVTGGLPAGELASRLDVSASSLSFHLKEMHWNSLVRLLQTFTAMETRQCNKGAEDQDIQSCSDQPLALQS